MSGICLQKVDNSSNSDNIESRTKIANPDEMSEGAQIPTKNRIHGSVYQRALVLMDDVYRLSGKVKFTAGVDNVGGTRQPVGPYAESSWFSRNPNRIKTNRDINVALLKRLKNPDRAAELWKRAGKFRECTEDIRKGLITVLEAQVKRNKPAPTPTVSNNGGNNGGGGNEDSIPTTIIKQITKNPITSALTLLFMKESLYWGGFYTGKGFADAARLGRARDVLKESWRSAVDDWKNFKKWVKRNKNDDNDPDEPGAPVADGDVDGATDDSAQDTASKMVAAVLGMAAALKDKFDDFDDLLPLAIPISPLEFNPPPPLVPVEPTIPSAGIGFEDYRYDPTPAAKYVASGGLLWAVGKAITRTKKLLGKVSKKSEVAQLIFVGVAGGILIGAARMARQAQPQTSSGVGGVAPRGGMSGGSPSVH